MTTSITGGLTVKTNWNHQDTDADSAFNPVTDRDTYSVEVSWTDGTGSNQLKTLYHARRTVTLATTTDDIDLAGVLTDRFGNTLTFATIREIFIYNRATTAGEDIAIGGAASNALNALFEGSQASQITVRASGVFVVSAPLDGYTIIAGSEDILRVSHSGSAGDIDYDIFIMGTT